MTSVFSQATHAVGCNTLECFCEMTQSAYVPYIVDVSEVLHSRDDWTSLADLWEELIDETGKDIFADVLHLIKWGVPFCKDGPVAYHELVLAVSEVLQSNTPAFYAWTNHDFFKRCIDGVTEIGFDSNWYPQTSVNHYKFLTAETILKIWKYALGYITVCNNAACYIARYKARIIKLIPCARHWHQDDWFDESKIFSELLRIYGVNFGCNLPAYQILHRLLDSPGANSPKAASITVRMLANLSVFSPNLIPVIWPGCTTDTPIKLFLLAEKRAQHLFAGLVNKRIHLGSCPLQDCTYTQLSSSWLFSFIRQQFHSNSISSRYISRVKRALLNIEMRC